MTFTLATVPTNGVLKLSGVVVTMGGTFTQDDINTNRLVYVHNGSETTSGSFAFTVSDGAGGTIGTTTFTVTVTPVNDAPVITSNGGGATAEPAPVEEPPGPVFSEPELETPGLEAILDADIEAELSTEEGVPETKQPESAAVEGEGSNGEPEVSARAANEARQGPAEGASGKTQVRPARADQVEDEEVEAGPLGRLQDEPEGNMALLASDELRAPVSVLFTKKLDSMSEDLQDAMEAETGQRIFVAKVTAASGLALSAGIVAWVLKGGTLLASLITTLPAWSHFDPLPILGFKKRKRKQDEQDGSEAAEEEDREGEALGRTLERSQAARGRSRGGGKAS